MPVLYVTQPGAEVRKKNARLQVEWQGQILMAIPIRLLERLVLLGPVQLSAAAIQVLLQARIPVLFCSMSGHYHGILSVGHEDTDVLLHQVTCYQDEAFRLNIAKTIVATKILHQQRLLRRYARNHPNPFLNDIADQLSQLLETLPARTSIAEVMGVEGQASALYFSAFGECLRQEGITFTERNRRPPRDPVNAVLSLSYMLLLNEIVSIVMSQGLHPGIGFLHEVNKHRPALALDLLELARQPIGDRLTLSLFNRRILTPEAFQKQPNGEVRLKEKGLKDFLHFYERAMTTPFRVGKENLTTFRDWLRTQVTELKSAIVARARWKLQPLEM